MAETKTSLGFPKNTTGALAYVLGWFSGVILLLLEKDSFVRFHAMQSIIAFGALSVIGMMPWLWWLRPLVWLLGFGLWLFLIFKAYQGEEYKLPVIGDISNNFLKKLRG